MFASYDICSQLRLIVRSKGEGDQNISEPHPGLSCPYLSICSGSQGRSSEDGVSEDLSMSAPSH